MSLQAWAASAPITTHYEITFGEGDDAITACIDYMPLDYDDETPWIWRVVDWEWLDSMLPCASPEEACASAEREIAEIIADMEASAHD